VSGSAGSYGTTDAVLTAYVTREFHATRNWTGTGWRILGEPELHLGRDVIVPDLAGWRRERLPRLPDEAYISMAPDGVCEVLSPSTSALHNPAARLTFVTTQ